MLEAIKEALIEAVPAEDVGINLSDRIIEEIKSDPKTSAEKIAEKL